MQGDVRIPVQSPSASRRELSVYDGPEKRSPEDGARDRAKHVEAHPFLYYLGQMVPGLQQEQHPVPSGEGDASAGSLAGAAGLGSAPAAALWGQEAANRLFAQGNDANGAAKVVEPADPLQAIPLFPAQLAAAQPVQPVEEAQVPHPVAPVEIPRIVLGQVDRMVQNGQQASTLYVKLDPPHLGKVDLAFTYAQQKVSVNVLAATQQAKDHLEMQLTHIRSILHGHNLPTGELKVVLAGDAGSAQGGGGEQDPERQQPNRYRRRRRSDPLEGPIAGI